ncbi:MAG: mechanosensitive ion channel family protein [Nanoarchaeota archaeon]
MIEQYISNQYLRALITFIAVFLVLRILFSILERLLLKLTIKTKTDIDDIILKRISLPVTILLFFFSLGITLKGLSLQENIHDLVLNIISSADVIILAVVSYLIIDTVFIRAWTKFTKKTKTELDDNLVSLFHGVIKIALIIIIALYILDLWGIQIGPLLAGLGIAGLAVALALQPTLSNIFSGVSMILDKSVRAGDLIYLSQETKGKIIKVGIRSTRILTFDNEIIIIPNSKLAESTIQNVALPDPKTRAVVQFSVAYGSDIEKVKKVVLKEINSLNNLSKEPSPIVRFIEMADSSLNFKTYFYINSFEHKWQAIDEANTKIYNALNKNNISIPFPQMDVHIKNKKKI